MIFRRLRKKSEPQDSPKCSLNASLKGAKLTGLPRGCALLAACLITSCGPSQLSPTTGQAVAIQSSRMPQELARITGTPWTQGNHVTTLINGAEFYPAILRELRRAKRSITLETFAFVDAPITREVSEILAQKARSGLSVKVILDQIGSRFPGKPSIAKMRNAGVQVHFVHPFKWYHPYQYNYRTHRKIIVVDGRVGFTGGAGFALAWNGDADTPKNWRDTMYQIQGPAVSGLQVAFAENWESLTGESLEGPAFYPRLTQQGSIAAQTAHDSPQDRKHPIAHSFLAAINGARHSLYLQQSYFIPNRVFRKALIAAARRGVAIYIIVPSENIDSLPTRYASQNLWDDFLREGIRIYQYEATMLHGKLLVADERLSIVGSANLDDRSFFINDENSLHLDSQAFAREQIEMFREDLKSCREITLENLPSVLEPAYKRYLFSLFRSQL